MSVRYVVIEDFMIFNENHKATFYKGEILFPKESGDLFGREGSQAFEWIHESVLIKSSNFMRVRYDITNRNLRKEILKYVDGTISLDRFTKELAHNRSVRVLESTLEITQERLEKFRDRNKKLSKIVVILVIFLLINLIITIKML